MIELGKIQSLRIDRETSIGVYLVSTDDVTQESVLLPQKQVPSGVAVGDEIEVFVYRDSKDRKIATTRKPKITLGELAVLEVLEVTGIGAFLDWGLEKDLFLPFKEQTIKIKKGKEYLVGLYIDKSDRLCATMKVYNILSTKSPYKENDRVKGYIYHINKEIGAFIAIDYKYQGLIPLNEMNQTCRCGKIVEARVTKVKDDGKLDLSLKEKAYIQMKTDAEILLDILNSNDGTLPFNDKSSPDSIKQHLNMSKSAFKRAIGRLLKEGKIKLIDNGIRKI